MGFGKVGASVPDAGDDVLTDLGNGDVLRLLDVKFREIDETDFLQVVEVPF